MAESNTTNAASKICACEYTVKRGDSFYLISHRLGIPLRNLLAANANINPARLMVGDVLCIPTEESGQHTPQAGGGGSGQSGEAEQETAVPPLTQTPAPETEADGDEEAVPDLDVPAQMGGEDTEIDPNYSVCPQDRRVVVAEGETAADIQLAHQLNLHSLKMANPAVDLDALQAGQELCIPEVNTPCPLPTHYTLGPGETLESVAMKFNLPIGSLLRANPCMAPADFEEGVCVSLPR